MGFHRFSLYLGFFFATTLASAGVKQAFIIVGDDPMFQSESLLMHMALDAKGFDVTTFDHLRHSIPVLQIKQALEEAALNRAADDEIAIVLHCHGSPLGLDPSAGTLQNHACCLNRGCSENIRVSDLSRISRAAAPTRILIIDRSCYGGSTVQFFGQASAPQNVCAISTSSSDHVSYWDVPALSSYVAADEIHSVRDLTHWSQTALMSQTPHAIQNRVYQSGCSGSMDLRRRLYFAVAPLFPYEITLSENGMRTVDYLNNSRPAGAENITGGFNLLADATITPVGAVNYLNLINTGFDDETERLLTDLETQAARLLSRHTYIYHIDRILGDYQRAGFRLLQHSFGPSELVQHIQQKAERLRANRIELDRKTTQLSQKLAYIENYEIREVPPSARTSRYDVRHLDIATLRAEATSLARQIHEIKAQMSVDVRQLNLELSIHEDLVCVMNSSAACAAFQL